MARKLALLAQRLEHEVGVDRVARVAEAPAGLAEPHAVDAVTHLEQPTVRGVARVQALDAAFRLRPPHGFELGVTGQHLIVHAADPVAARADLAVGHGGKRWAERPAERAEHLLDAVERDAADQKNLLRHDELAFRMDQLASRL
jgi:hypothetical protein